VYYYNLLEGMKETGHLKGLGVDVRTILKWVIRKYGGRV
jgi:hypothetical protein